MADGSGDGHVCNICNMDFLELCDLVAHRKMCSAAMAAVTRKRAITYDDEDKENLMSQPPNKKMIMNGSSVMEKMVTKVLQMACQMVKKI